MAAKSRNRFQAPVEPVLEMDDIQGEVVPGFLKPHQTLLGLRVPAGIEVIWHFKMFLGELSGEISTAAQTLADRRAYRNRSRASKSRRPEDEECGVLTAIGFSSAGLKLLTPSASLIPGEAFHAGLIARSSLLGDPKDASSEGAPTNWVVGSPGAELDALVVVAGNRRKDVTERADRLASQVGGAGISVAYRQDGDVRTGEERGHEHFGFDDGISQPGIRGRASEAPGDFITERHIDPSEIPEVWLYGYPGQDLIWSAEFVIGYSKTGSDPLQPAPSDSPVPEWTRNGSFLVFRRLRQDVGLFWRTMREIANELAKLPGFSGMDDTHLASLLVGRWPSGAPVNRAQGADIPELGADAFANNNFQFDSNTPFLKLAGSHKDAYPQGKADPAGAACPWAAHIKKMNTRDSASDMGGRESTYDRRLLRVGVPFGNSLVNRYAPVDEDPEKGNRGLLFLCVQASIERQFEFLVSSWANDPSRPKMPGGNDMLIGQNSVPADGVRRCSLFGSGLQQAQLSASQQWVIPTGGGYFFMPSISALSGVLAK